MKKLLALAAMGILIIACNMSKLERVNRTEDLILFTVTNGGMTKAIDVTTSNLTAFELTAFNHGTEASPYINAVSYTGGSGSYASTTPYYWPKSNLDFYAWSAGAAEGQVVKTNYKTFVVTPSATPANQVDLVFAGKTDIGKDDSTDGAIALNFRHAESKVVVKVKNTAPNLKFVISDWKLGFIDDAGTFTYNGQGVNYDGSTDGNNNEQLDISMWSGNTDASAAKTYTNTLASNVNVAANANELLLNGEMIVIPQTVTAASAYADASEESAVNGSYIGLKLKILNRENDAVIYDNGASATAWAIWPANFAFEPGKKYTYTVDLCGGGYYETNNDSDADLDAILEGAVINFAGVTIDDFAQQTPVDLPLEPTPTYTFASFAGLNIAPANLYYNGSTFEIKDSDWNHDSFNSVYGKNEGSYYFTALEVGQFFDSRGSDYSTSSGNIDNNGNNISFAGYDDWRIPTKAELITLTTGSIGVNALRPGSSVNGTNGAKYALIQLTGVTHAGNSTPSGLLIFPDDLTITGKTLDGINNNSPTFDVTASELQEYLDQGCAFLPMSSINDNGDWQPFGGAAGAYLSATSPLGGTMYGLKMMCVEMDGDVMAQILDDSADMTRAYGSVRLVRGPVVEPLPSFPLGPF